MGLENIQLPEFLIAELYKNSLVELEKVKQTDTIIQKESIIKAPAAEISAKAETEIPKQASQISYLGENKKHVCVLTKNAETVNLPDNELTFLTNILSACKLNLGDIAIINTAHQTLTYGQLQENLDSKFVLLFDVTPREIDLPFTIPQFQVQNYSGCKYLAAPGLSAMDKPTADAKDLKRNLWECLKKMFEL